MSDKKPAKARGRGAPAKKPAKSSGATPSKPSKSARSARASGGRASKTRSKPAKASRKRPAPAAPKETAADVTYVYAIVRGARAPVLEGVPKGLPHLAPPRVLAAGEDLWLVVASAPGEHYSAPAIERSLKDLATVGTCGVGHSEVVQFVHDEASEPAVLPMKMFTLFVSDERAAHHVNAERARLERAFSRVGGAHEWGVRVVFDPEVARQKAAEAAAQEPADATGAGFLRRKKAVRDERLELHKRARARVDQVHEQLATGAREARRRAHTGAWEGVPHLLEGAYLVARDGEGAFLEAVRAAKSELEATGCYSVFLIGPWPPYSFLDEATPA